MVSGPLAASAASLIEIDHFHVIFELRPNGLLKTVAVISRTAVQEQTGGLVPAALGQKFCTRA